MTKIIPINLEEDFIIEDPTEVITQHDRSMLTHVKIKIDVTVDNVENYVNMISKWKANNNTSASIKVKGYGKFRYKFEFHECLGIYHMAIDAEHSEIRFDCIYYDQMLYGLGRNELV